MSIRIAVVCIYDYNFFMIKNVFDIPDYKFARRQRVMVSLRLSDDLHGRLREIARRKGWMTTALIVLVLDLYCQNKKIRSLKLKNIKVSDLDRSKVALRLPEALIEELDQIAEDNHLNRTEVIHGILDMYLYYEKS